MNRRLQRIRDDRFPRTNPENSLIEVRNYAELLEAAQRQRESLSAVAGQPILISSAPGLENDVNH